MSEISGVPDCVCSEPTDACPVYGHGMRGRQWEICSGRCSRPCDENKRRAYKIKWAREAGVYQNQVESWTVGQKLRSVLGAFGRFVVGGMRLTTAELAAQRQAVCESCPHWTGRCRICGCGVAMPAKWRLPDECCPDQPPRWGPAPAVSHSWSVGVTVAGNRGTISQTIVDLAAAGWPHATIFAEPDANVELLPNVVRRQVQLGAWPNRRAAIRELAATESQYILVCEDDVRIAPGARMWLDSVGWPSDQCGMLSLYRHAGQIVDGKWRPSDAVCGPLNQRGYQQVLGHLFGTCAVAFPRWAAERMLADQEIDREFPDQPDRFSDLRLRHWLKRAGLEYWVANPSWVQHRTDVPSVLGHGTGMGMQSDTFIGENDGPTRELWPV